MYKGLYIDFILKLTLSQQQFKSQISLNKSQGHKSLVTLVLMTSKKWKFKYIINDIGVIIINENLSQTFISNLLIQQLNQC